MASETSTFGDNDKFIKKLKPKLVNSANLSR